MGEGLKINEIGYLPQQTALQRDFPASVEEIVMSGFLGRMGLRPFYTQAEKKEASELMEKTGIADLAKDATESFQVGSSRESFSPGRFVQPEKFFCWMSLFPDLIRWLWQICIRLSTS